MIVRSGRVLILSPAARDRLIALWAEGRKVAEIAATLGCHRETVRAWCRRLGLPRRNRRARANLWRCQSCRRLNLGTETCVDCGDSSLWHRPRRASIAP